MKQQRPQICKRVISSWFGGIPMNRIEMHCLYQGASFGGWSQVTNHRTEIGASGVTTTVASNGFIGGIAYGHWLQEELAFRISASMMAANIEVQTSVSGVTTDFAAVAPVADHVVLCLHGTGQIFPQKTKR